MSTQILPWAQLTSLSEVHNFLQGFSFNNIARYLTGQTPIQDMGPRPASYFQSPEYIAATASEKQMKLWESIFFDTKSGKFPSDLTLPGIFLEGMEPTYHTKGDALPSGITGTREKYIHSVGAVGRVKLNADGASPFSGIFRGANYGLLRLSCAIKPTDYLAPGMGLKFLRDGMDSANLVSMWSLNGQPGNWNFFANKFTTIIGGPKSLETTALCKKFSGFTEYIQVMALSEMARFDQKGEDAGDNIKLPYELEFTPSSAVSTLFPTTEPSDHMAYVEQLASIPADTVVYEVHGWDAPKQAGGKLIKVGELQLEGQMTASKWGDQHLFFRHQVADDDIKIHPEWKEYYPTYPPSKGQKCPFAEALGL